MDKYEQEADRANLKDPVKRGYFIDAMRRADEHIASIDEEEYVKHVLTTPLLEILSVSINSNEEGAEPASQVYGTIQVIDGEGALSILYNRDENDTETICNKGGLLTLTHSDNGAISPLYKVEVKIDINDKIRKANIANGLFSLDLRTIKDVDYDKVQTQYVDGKCGRAAVQYITYRHASIAAVLVKFFKDSSDDSNCINVYGKIVATYGNISRVLFERAQDESERVEYWYPMDLCVLVVPAHSSLVIAVDLWNSDTQEPLFCREEMFKYSHNPRKSEKAQIRVDWYPLYFQNRPETKLKHSVEVASTNKEMTDRKKRQFPFDQHRSLPDKVDFKLLEAMGKLRLSLKGTCILEVFSVSIVSDSGEGFDLWGTIKVETYSDEFIIFDKQEKEDAVKLLSNQTVPIIPLNYIAESSEYKIKLKLKDAQDRKLGMGMARWDTNHLTCHPDVCDRPLCCVIRGDIGYAAVHCAIFDTGVQAVLKVVFDSPESNDNCFQVHGSVLAGYKSKYFKYETSYEKKHYRNELFQKHPENPQVLSSGFEVPLSKYVVRVPLNSTLLVDVGLMITRTDDTLLENVETFHGQLNFRTPSGRLYNKEQRIRGRHHNEIAVSISWSDIMPVVD